MAQEPRTPWSRWDLPVPAGQPAPRGPPAGLAPPIDLPHFDPFFGPRTPQLPPSPQTAPGMPIGPPPTGPVDVFLVAKEPNADDPSFYNCIYGIPNTVQQIVQECHVEVDCCEHTCCDTNWQAKYASAIVLLSLICLVVVIALIVWLIVWLVNRSRDKAQRKKLLEETEAQQQTAYIPHAHFTAPYSSGTNPNGGTLRRY